MVLEGGYKLHTQSLAPKMQERVSPLYILVSVRPIYNNVLTKMFFLMFFAFRMKGDFKIITILLSIVILHATYTDGWGVRVRIPRVRIPTPRIRIPTPRIRIPTPRIRVPNPVRVVRRVVRKAGEGIKTGVRKAGEGIKTGVRKTGEGLKKVGEGLKKAGEVTGKHLYKGLRETGKALITASSFVSDILDRVSILQNVCY